MAANSPRSSAEKAKAAPQSRQVSTASLDCMLESVVCTGRRVPLACFAQQLLSRVTLPVVREVGSRRWSHVDVRLAVLAQYLSATAEDPYEIGRASCRERV